MPNSDHIEMKCCSKCGVEKPLSEFYPQSRGRLGCTAECRECHKKRMRVPDDKRVRRRGPTPGYAAMYRRTHAEELATYMTKWRKENPPDVEAAARRMAVWRKANPEKNAAALRRYAKANPAKVTAKTKLRKARKLNATPAWANQFFIVEIYDLAQRRTKMLGFEWHVDHIVPLRSPLVCGLHVENNLQVIPAVQNISKSNRHWPDMPA